MNIYIISRCFYEEKKIGCEIAEHHRGECANDDESRIAFYN